MSTVTLNGAPLSDAQKEDFAAALGLVRGVQNPVTGGIGFTGIGNQTLAGMVRGGRQNLGQTLAECDTLTGYSVSSGATMELVPASVPEIGKSSQSIKVTVPAGQTKNFDFAAFTARYNPGQSVAMVMENLTSVSVSFGWRFANDAGWANYVNSDLATSRRGLQTISGGNSATRTEFATVAGSPAFNSFTRCRLSITAPAGEDAVFIIHRLSCAVGGLPVIEITADDGNLSDYTEIYPMLNVYGLRASFAIARRLVGSSAAWMTERQIQELHDAGNDILVHGDLTIPSFGTFSEAMAEVAFNADYIRSRGWRGGDIYVYPGGHAYYNAADIAATANALRDMGFNAAYRAAEGIELRYAGLNRYGFRRQPVNAATTTASIEQRIDNCIATGRSMSLMLHKVVPSGATGQDTNRQIVDEIFAILANRQQAGKIAVMTSTEALAALR